MKKYFKHLKVITKHKLTVASTVSKWDFTDKVLCMTGPSLD